MSSYDEFIQIYNEIDHYMRKALRVDRYAEHGYMIDQMAKQSGYFASHAQELRALAQLRNALVHNPFMRVANPLAIPNEKAVAQYRLIRDSLLKPPTAMTIAVPAHKLYTTTLNDSALKVMHNMQKFTFTHVPVMEGDRMIGVFSENSILAYLVDQQDIIIPKEATIAEFKNFIGFEKHPSEHFVFIARNTSLSEVHKIFNEALKVQKRIGVMFVTNSGKQTEKALGIITAWDLAHTDIS